MNVDALEWRVRRTGVIAAGLCLSVALLVWFGFRAVREWQRSSALFTLQRTTASADQLSAALMRDMRGAGNFVLGSSQVNRAPLDRSYELDRLLVSAFARYPYPESFFGWRGVPTSSNLTFFDRVDRLPPWASQPSQSAAFPVVVTHEAAIAKELVGRILEDTDDGVEWSLFELTLAGVPYQVIVRTFYRDPFREHPVGGFGFSVNLSWVRRFYFPQLAGQIARVTGMNEGIALSILDDQGAPITTKPFRSSGSVSSRRTFPVLFADPLVLGLNRPPDLPDRRWTVQVQDANPSLSSGPFSGTWMLLVVALTAGLLTIALTMAAHAARVSANLFEIRSDFIATVTHELKTPLATLRAIGEVISSGRISGLDAVHEYAQLIVQESKRLTRLVDNSLAYARVTDVADVYHFEPLDLRSLLDESLRGFNSQFIAQGFELDISIPNDLSPMSGDRTSLGLAFDNLIDNAMRYSGDRRWLSVKVEQLNHMIAVIISDKGVGIAADELAHVRRKFFRGRAAGSGGSGLGLAIVDRIVSAHSGTMTIKSVVGAGTSVSVHLPTY